jgi:two-component system alkaline phosphatase synthesis response regulator PhoP
MVENLKHKVLVVDDDPQVYKIVSRLLDTEKYEVESASDGLEALKKIRESRPELLILDLMMPGMSGLEVCEKIKGSPSTQDIMILILSAKDAQLDRRRSFEMGADDYISKPFHIASLARKIEYMFEKKSGDRIQNTVVSSQ